jgi:hypothetical protein
MLKETIPTKSETISNEGDNRVFTGIVNECNKGGVQIRFLNGLMRQVLVKDLETVQNFPTIYTPGKVVRVALNKLGRLTMKESVIYLNDN